MLYLELRNLSIRYSKNVILENVNLTVHDGERIGILGKNGTGKTTLVETILGVNNAFVSGELLYFNDIEFSMKAVFQEYEFDRVISLKKIYKLYSLISGIKPTNNIKELFQSFGLADKQDSKFYKLSGGQKQKFKLLMWLSLRPRLVILDEITSSLDIEWRKEILMILKDYFAKNPNASLILISHDYRELQHLTKVNYVIENKQLKPINNLGEYFDEYEFIK